MLPRVPCDPGDDDFHVPGFQAIQFLVCVCFAMTSNKTQDQFFSYSLDSTRITSVSHMASFTFLFLEKRVFQTFQYAFKAMRTLQLT